MTSIIESVITDLLFYCGGRGKIYWFYFVCLSALPACMCTICVSGAYGSQKKVLDFLDLQLQDVVSSHVGPGNWSEVRVTRALNHETTPLAPVVGSDIGVVVWFPFLFQHHLAIFRIPGAGFAGVYHRTQELKKYSAYTRVSQRHHWTKDVYHQAWQLGFCFWNSYISREGEDFYNLFSDHTRTHTHK